MEAKLTIKNFGPVKDCSMDINNFTILTGAQATGKSTIAKSIYFFLTVKDEIEDIYFRRPYRIGMNKMHELVKNEFHIKFRRLFGTYAENAFDTLLRFDYSDKTFFQFRSTNDNGWYIEFSNNVEYYINLLDNPPVKLNLIESFNTYSEIIVRQFFFLQEEVLFPYFRLR